MLSISRKTKKTTAKSEAKVSSSAESSKKLSKTLKRKNDAEHAENTQEEQEPAVVSKRAKKDVSNPTKQESADTIAKPSQKNPDVVAKTSKKNAKDIAKPSKENAKTKPRKISTPELEEEAGEEADEQTHGQESDQDSEEDDHLHGFSTDDDDSSDEDDDAMDPEFDVRKLPTVAKDDASVKRKLEKAKKQPIEETGVLFLSRLPHGFYEDQLKAYFSQFGDVTRLRVSRNKKTGKSKHYGFIEFDSLAVAKIVAETMDNYLLMGHILRCKLIPKEEVHPELWIGANRKWRVVPREQVARAEQNKPRTEEEQARATSRLLNRQQARKEKLAKAGIKYDFDAVGYKKPAEVIV